MNRVLPNSVREIPIITGNNWNVFLNNIIDLYRRKFFDGHNILLPIVFISSFIKGYKTDIV